jgi:DNA-binding CsgD family transcriptional regulator
VIREKQGDDDGAMAYYEKALALYRELNLTGGMTHTVMNMGDTAFRQGDLERSALYTEEALTLARRLKDPMYTALSLTNAGQLALARGEATAAALFRESLALAVETHNDWFIADALAGLAGVAAAAGDPASGARWLGTAQTICDAIGTPAVPHHALFARSLSEVKAKLNETDFTAAWEEGRACPTLECVADAQRWQVAPAVPARSVAPAKAASPAPAAGAGHLNLTERELDVLRLVVEGKSSREIAEELYISPRTATTHVANILSKLGVNSRSAAVAVAFQSGIV